MSDDTTATPAPDAKAEWWQDPNLPWEHKPTRAELWCYGALSFYGVYSLVMMPLRAWLLTIPELAALLNGSIAAFTTIGAKTAIGAHSWGVAVLLYLGTVLSSIKWDWIYWWAGKLWGHAFVRSVGGKQGRAKRFTDTLERLTLRHPMIAMLVTYLPVPFAAVIYVVMGAAGMRVRRFLLLNLCASALFYAGYFALGYAVGAPAVHLLELYSRYAVYVAIATLVGMIVWMVLRQSRQQRAATPVAAPADDAVSSADEHRPG